MTTTQVIQALGGGALLGAALALVTAMTGQQLGISGMAAAILHPRATRRAVPAAFLVGVIACGALLGVATDFARDASDRPLAAFAIGGVLVGWGARRANGCTSGHGVLGVARLGARSIVAIALFALAASTVVALWPGGVS